LRVPQTDLYKIWSEPDVQAFLEKPRRKSVWMRTWIERFDDMLRAAPGEIFLAVTALDGPQASFVAGFSFAGSQQSAQGLARHLREQLLPGAGIVSTFRGNWYLCASDAGLLEALLARFDGKPVPALAGAPLFQQSTAPLGIGQDLVLYGKPASLAGRLDFLTGLAGEAKSTAQEAVAMATKIDGARLRDIIFLPGSGSAQRSALSRRTLSLTPPQTLLYYATEVTLLRPSPGAGSLASLVPGLIGIEQRLAEKGLTWDDLPNAIGPEVGAMVEWPEDAVLPTLLLASEVRDRAKALNFMEILTHPPPPGAAWEKEERDGVTTWNAPAQGFSFMRPAAALTDRFALLGISLEAIASALPKAGIQSPSLGQSAAFQEVARFIPEQASAFGYLDLPRLFERVYRMARPFITLSLAFSAEAGAPFDAGKLPPGEVISKHLSATVLSQSRNEGGMIIESSGSITLPELLLGVGAGGIATGLPDLSGVVPGGLNRAAPPKARVRPTPSIDSAGGGASGAPDLPPSEKKASDYK